MAEPADFRARQYAFAAHIRDPAAHPAPADVPDARMKVYRELLFNNIRGFLENGFPVLHGLYEPAAWERLARAFFAGHRCRTPYFTRIAEEFLQFLQDEYRPGPVDPPFLLELAHYEWVELALYIAEDAPLPDDMDPHGDLLAGAPVLSPLAWPLVYRWPVHRLGPDYRPAAPPAEPTYLVVYRDAGDTVRFLTVNAVAARLLQLIQEDSGRSGEALLRQIAAELQHPDPDLVVQGGHQTLLRLHRAGVLPGTRPA